MALRNWRDHLMTSIADISVFRRQPEVVLWRLCQTSGATETTCSFTEPAPEIFHVLVIFSSRGLGRDARGRVNPEDPPGRSYTARSQKLFRSSRWTICRGGNRSAQERRVRKGGLLDGPPSPTTPKHSQLPTIFAPAFRMSAMARAESPGCTSTPAMALPRTVTSNPARSRSSTECFTQ
jgi:hypothetical protein